MKKNKKILVILLACVVTILFGCKKSDVTDGEDGQVTIDFAIHVANPSDQEPAFYSVVEEFEKQNPDIKINLIGKEQSEHVKNIKMMSQSDKLPDLFWMLPASAKELYENDMLADLTPFLDDRPNIRESFENRENMLTSFEDGGIQYGLPFQPLITGFYYNSALFEKYNLKLPETFEDLIEVSKVFEENGITTISKGAKDDYSVWSFLLMLSRYGYFDKIDAILEGNDIYNNNDFINFYTRIDELRKVGAFPKNVTTQTYFQAVEQFMAGNAAMLDSGAWDTKKLEESEISKDIGFWWGPTFSDGVGEQKLSSIVPSAPLVVSKKAAESTEKLESIYKFLEFYYGEAGIQLMVDNQLPPMTNIDVAVDAEKNPVFFSLVEAVSKDGWTSQKNQPDLVVSESVANAMYDSIYGVINGTYTPEQAAQLVQEKIEVSK